MEKRELMHRPDDWKAKKDKTSYTLEFKSGERDAVYEVQILRATPGDYVVDSWVSGPLAPLKSNCFGAPTFHLEPGQIAFLGDFVPVWNPKFSGGLRYSDVVHAGFSDTARATLAFPMPELAQRLKPVTWRNRATYSCGAQFVDRTDLPGAEALPYAAPSATATKSTGAP